LVDVEVTVRTAVFEDVAVSVGCGDMTFPLLSSAVTTMVPLVAPA
jgi:hypothetical protein